jgi:hypothetical protein
MSEGDFDLTIERAAARVRRYLADPQACRAAIEQLMAELRADGLSGEAKIVSERRLTSR